MQTIKPNKTAFVSFSIVKSLIIWTIIFLIGFFTFGLEVGIGIGIIIILRTIWKFLNLNAAYKKTHFDFLEDKIVVYYGNLFSDSSIEIVIDRITHVYLIKPFLENKLFNVGTVMIELAGSAIPEGVFILINNSEQIYEQIRNVMQERGFKLTKQELLQKDTPNILGVIFETIKIAIFGFIGLIWIGSIILGIIMVFSPQLGGIITLIVFIFYLLFIIKTFFELKIREYYIYTDTIEYFEGFLTKVSSFMPAENLANADITQTLIDKIFDLYDVKISCQGSNHEILFKNLKQGLEMEKHIDNLIQTTKQLDHLENKKVNDEVIKFKINPAAKEKLIKDTTFTAELKINFKRLALIPSSILFTILILINFFGLILGLLPISLSLSEFLVLIILGTLIGGLIASSSTIYKITPNGIAHNFDFLFKKNIEFANDKITGIVISRSIIDRWMNTFSVTFFSIGSSTNIIFNAINYSQELEEKLLSKFGVIVEDTMFDIKPNMTLGNFFKQNIVILIIDFLLIIGSIFIFPAISIFLILITILIIIYKSAFYKRVEAKFAYDFIAYNEGIWFVKTTYATYDNIKDIEITKSPMCNNGLIHFNISGESIIKTDNGTQIIPHGFFINYVDKITQMDDVIDTIIYSRPTKQELSKTILKSEKLLIGKSSLGNELLPGAIILGIIGVIISVVLFGIGISASSIDESVLFIMTIVIMFGWIIYVLILAFGAWKIKVREYSIQPYRVVAKSGIFWKAQKSIIFTKIDHIAKFQGFLNKVFKNGSIVVHTTGSSLPEMVIVNIPNQTEFYEKLEQYYK
ncbi:MAG: PH domain-containing protein [archaeon]|jgi:membrane protein YdbS with pleckstrin-like domain